MSNESVLKLTAMLLFEEIKAVLYFPLWWYSRGLLRVLRASGRLINDFQETLGFMIWLKNLFVPMFGQRDIAGRLISFFLRLVQIIFRGIVLLIFILIIFVFIVIWLILPIFVIYQIIFHI
jgi:hypothetical protein